MGRYVRTILRAIIARSDLRITLLVRDPQASAEYRRITGDAVEIAPLAAARERDRFDAIWYPWNGVRFHARAPAVVTINDDFAFTYPAGDPVARWREQRPIRRAVAHARRIVTISRWSRAVLSARFGIPASKIAILPLVPDACFSPADEPSPYREPFVLAVGAGEQRKNVAFLAAAMARAFPAAEVRLVIVGRPGAAEAARFPPGTELLARVGDSELRRLYRTAAAVAVPSLAEGFGLVAAEAQACGAAVIAANTSALPEAVGPAGILCDPHDAGAWANALRELLYDPACNARFRALARTRWSNASASGMTDALLRTLELAIHDRA